jgi:class 3 adenylate cyclase
MTPKENFNFINAYLKRIGPLIRKNGGFINHYFGDGFIALFKDASANAVVAALEIFEEIELYNQERIEVKRQPINLGIGIHTGEVMMGINVDK